MSNIRILSEDVSNRIAAGEVIERPASVVKELLENALDSGAKRIRVQIQKGGRSLIRVIDDGCGMDREDSLLCLEAHATSKIRDSEDIQSIRSFGFRGEALPSIASVSRLTIRSRPAPAEAGTEVSVSGGVIQKVNECGTAPGTEVTVRNLFYNTPARRKFMRKTKTEEAHIEEIVTLLALANPAVGVELTIDERPVVSVQPDSDLAARAAILLGRHVAADMMTVNATENGITIHGLVAKPGLTRSTRREQRTFVNHRPVQSDTLFYAIRDAYHTMVMKGRYPPVLLFVDIDPDQVDVNVHPAKREIRFRDPRMIGRVSGSAIREALRGVAGSSADMTPDPRTHAPWTRTPFTATPTATEATFPEMDTAKSPFHAAAANALTPGSCDHGDTATDEVDLQTPPHIPAAIPDQASGDDITLNGTSVSAAERADIERLTVLGAIANLYLLAEGPQGLVLIDQHAAHERILFEKFLSQARDRDGVGQGLLMPVTVDVSATDADVLRSHMDSLRALGFEIEKFGGNAFIISAVPAHFPQQDLAGLLKNIIDDLRAMPDGNRRRDEESIAMCACKAAVKAHDFLATEETAGLLEALAVTELPYTCPHGRPTMINISWRELDKRFGRRV